MKRISLLAGLMVLISACSPWNTIETTPTPFPAITAQPDEIITPTTSQTSLPTRQPTATFTPSPSQPQPTEIKGRSFYDPDLEMDCLFWESISPLMEGQQICVYGKVSSTLLQHSGWYMFFKDDGKSFYLIILKEGDQYFYFPSIEQGLCVQAVGEVKTYADIPRVEILSINYWQASNYYCEKLPEA